MLQTQVFQSFTQRPSRGVLKFGAYMVFVGSSYGVYWHQSRKAHFEERNQAVSKSIEEWNPTELNGFNLVHYPWAQKDSIEKWEHKLVKMLGYFREERMFIKRQREGKDGYLVIAPFITACKNADTDPEQGRYRTSQIFVNIGWVPVEHKEDIEMSTEPLGTLDFDSVPPNERTDIYTELTRNQNLVHDDYKKPMVEFVGLVRKGEQPNILRGRRNWIKEGVFNYIDLWYMSRLFRSQNLHSSNMAYIERVVPELDEESETNFPIPATKDTWDRGVVLPQTHANLSYLYVISGVLSLGIMALRR